MLKFRNLCGLKACFLGCICAFLFSYSALADVCFLPTGGCVALDSLYSQTIGGADDDCSGYDREIKGQGWDCTDTCEAHGHTYYNCVPKSCGAGYQPGITSCERGYTHEYEKEVDDEGNETYVYSGDLKCGLCVAPGECPLGSQLSDKCEDSGYLSRDTQYYVGTQVCHVCLSDNCADGMKKYCSWSSGSTSGPSGSNRATSDEWYTSTARTQYGSMCYACCDNICTKGSQEVTSCDPSTEIFRTLETTACGSTCNECCNNVCSSGSLNTTSCNDGYYLKNHGTTDCGNSCDSCEDCGGTTTAPTGCRRCTEKKCGNQTRYYDCYDLSDECSTGSKEVTCTYANDVKTSVGTTDCGNTCYSCVCTATASDEQTDETDATQAALCYEYSDTGCGDGCGSTRGCYVNKCSDSEVCYNSSCCTPTASDATDDEAASKCLTWSDSCDDGCGGSRGCYQSACSSNQTCQNGTCVDNCSPSKTCASYSMSSESGGCYSTTAETKSDGCTDSLTCYAYACSSDQSCDNGTCVDVCTPTGDETRTDETDAAQAALCYEYSATGCDNGCGSTRGCYVNKCSSSQVCYNSSCCTPTASDAKDDEAASKCLKWSDSCDDGCGGRRGCYQSKCNSDQSCDNGTCVDNECTPTRDCSSYSILYAGAMQSGTYDTCDDGCGTKRYSCKSGYTYSEATKRCESGGSSGGGSGSTTYDASLKCTSKGTVTQYTHCPNQNANVYSCTFTANSSAMSAKIFSNGIEEAGSIRGSGTTYTVYGCGSDLRAQFYASNKLLCDGTLTKDSYGYLVKSCKY